MKPNEISHYKSLIKQDTANRILIKQLQLDKQELEKQLSLNDVSHRRELLDAFVCTMEFDTKHGTYQEDIDYFLEAHKSV